MGLFSFRKKPAGPFEFVIEDAFALRSGGAAVAGRMLSGSLRKGAKVLCVSPEGASFVCQVQMIEQPDPARQGEYVHRRTLCFSDTRPPPGGLSAWREAAARGN